MLQNILRNGLNDTGIDPDQFFPGHARLTGMPDVITATELPAVLA